MNSRFSIRVVSVVVLFLAGAGVCLPPVSAAAPEPPDLYKAFYLEHAAKDYAGAKALYDKLLASDLPKESKQAVRAGADRCRDQLAAKDFASLMPADALVYVELNRPGRLLEQLSAMLGIPARDMQEVLAARPSAEDGGPFHVPQEMAISPALFEAIEQFGGAAVAVTRFDPQGGPPSGVLVIHHGDMPMVKGLLETGFQFAPTAEKIAGMPTFAAQIPDGPKVSGILTEGLLILGSSPDLVEGATNRLIGKEKTCLGKREDLAAVMKERGDATLFAFADLQAILKVARANIGEHDQHDFAMANTLCDLDSLRWVTFSAGINDGALGAQLTLRLAEGHHSLAYNLLRLPPMSRRCLKHVPPDCAAFIGLGLNPVAAAAAMDAAAGEGEVRSVTGLDIGREIFGNIHELCAFVMPGEMIQRQNDGGPPVVPNAGLVFTVNDTARSRALWTQLLSLPGLFGGDKAVTPGTVRIGEQDVTTFAIPRFGKVYLTEMDHCIAIGATRNVIKDMVRAGDREKNVLTDEQMGKVIAALPKDSSLMVVAHMGRLAKVAQGAGNPGVAAGASQAVDLCEGMVCWAALGQSPNEMTLRAAVKGLPNLNLALKRYGPMAAAFANAATAQAASRHRGPKAEAKARTSEDDAAELTPPRPPAPPVPPAPKAKSETKEKKPAGATVNELTAKLIEAAQEKDYEKALELALAARDLEDTGLTNYNVACMYSLKGDKDKAFKHLNRAIKLGMGGTGHDLVNLMKTDTDLDNLRDDPRFKRALRTAERKAARDGNPAREPDEDSDDE